MTTTPSPTATPTTPLSTPAIITCLVCNYSLAGLPADSQCPECGYDIRLTLEGVENIPADTLRLMARGATTLLWATILALILPLSVFETVAMNTFILGFVLLVTLCLLTPTGVWALTPRLPRRAHRVAESLRIAARVAAVALPVAAIAVPILNSGSAFLVALGLGCALPLLLAIYANRLGQSLHADDVAAASRVVIWSNIIAATVVTASYLGAIATGAGALCLGLIAVIPLGVAFFALAFMFSILASTLRDRAGLADWHTKKSVPA